MRQVALCPALGLSVFVVSLCIAECRVIIRRIVLGFVFRGVWGSIRSGKAHKLPIPRAGAQDNFRDELDKGNFFEDMKEQKSPRNGWMDIWGVGHGRASSSRGVLETGVVFGRQK